MNGTARYETMLSKNRGRSSSGRMFVWMGGEFMPGGELAAVARAIPQRLNFRNQFARFLQQDGKCPLDGRLARAGARHTHCLG